MPDKNQSLTKGEINNKIRQSIMQRLPDAIEVAMESYHDFVIDGAVKTLDDEDASNLDKNKNFKSHHDACKVAIAHINLLLDLANEFLKQMDKEEGGLEAVQTLTAQVQKAMAEMSKSKPINNKK